MHGGFGGGGGARTERKTEGCEKEGGKLDVDGKEKEGGVGRPFVENNREGTNKDDY